MSFYRVDHGPLKIEKEERATAEYACLADVVVKRTVEPCLSAAVRLQPNELTIPNVWCCQSIPLNLWLVEIIMSWV